MAFTCRETAENVFYQARLHAAEKDTAFESRTSAGAMLGISSTRLYQIERGIQETHRDEVLIMVDTYNAPELLNYYCTEMCPVGRRIKERAQAYLDEKHRQEGDGK